MAERRWWCRQKYSRVSRTSVYQYAGLHPIGKIRVHQLNNFRGTPFYPGHRCFASWDRGGHVCFGAA